jgi:chemotaxis protein methyltransferase CheR
VLEAQIASMTQNEFVRFKELLFNVSGITLRAEKHVMVENRLAKRVRKLKLSTYSQYYDLVVSDEEELQTLLNLLTTNTTYFFREKEHFDFLQKDFLPKFRGNSLRVWSAACSRGAEPYTIAMVLDDALSIKRLGWEVFASDINMEELEKAVTALYPMSEADKIPDDYLRRYCLKGDGAFDGQFLIKETLAQKVRFFRINLMEKLPPDLGGEFDVIFLRNMLIYFSEQERKDIVERLATKLKRGGLLFIGHSETLNRITDVVRQIKPTIYIKP